MTAEQPMDEPMQPTEYDWDPRDPSVLTDQRRTYDEMRERCPVAHSEFMGWSLFRHADVVRVLADPETFSSRSRHLAIPNGMDPPEHTAYREAIAPAFTAERVAALEGRARQIAADLIEPMVERVEAEVVGTFAEPFALRTLCAFLGWPEELWECLGGWTHGNQQAALTRDRGAGRALARLITDHVKLNLAHHRTHDDWDVTDVLLATKVDDAPLSDEQIVSVLRNWIAGEGTVAGGISLLLFHLAREPDLQDELRADPSLIPNAVEEILRVDGPLVANRRTTTKPVEIGGRRIGEGETISLMWIGANRDPEAFDDPDEIRVERDRSASLLWGRGIHVCLGAPLARLELRIAAEELLARTHRLEVGGRVRRSAYPANGLAELDLRLN